MNKRRLKNVSLNIDTLIGETVQPHLDYLASGNTFILI